MSVVYLLLRGWAAIVRASRRGLEVVGVLGALENWARRSRIALWLRSLFSLYDVRDFVKLDLPWWTLDSMSLVDQFLTQRPGARVFEWGSGASTMWLEKRAAQVTSVEYDPEWADMMRPLVGPSTTLLVVPATPTTSPTVPSQMWGHKHLDYREYVAAIDTVDGEFDLIVIDGRARSACLAAAMDRLSPDGMIVFDNTNRRRYRPALDAVSDTLRETTTTGLTPSLPWSTETTLLRKPSP